jgi:hypothetical protein
LILTPCIVEEAVFNVGVEGGAAEESNAHCYLLLLGQVQGRRGRGVRLVLLCSLYYLLGLIYFFIHIFVQRNICCMYVHRGAPAEIKSSQLQLVLCLFSVALFWSDATDCLWMKAVSLITRSRFGWLRRVPMRYCVCITSTTDFGLNN